ncbi:MAG: nucleotidyltransferase domain-containing protein [Actinomycetota bacterium]|nr:nucleotidyltransferase domain-containing protein [Actinomycetota bacterium]
MADRVDRADPVDVARALVVQRFPDARAAWLGGSVVHGTHTATSDLDIIVLLPGPPAPFRESLLQEGWPVEVFAHTGPSLAHYRAKDAGRRQPTMMRLIADSVILLDTDGSAEHLQRECRREVEDGPHPLTSAELAALRYGITDLLDDLTGTRDDDERAVVAMSLFNETAELLLTGAGCWTGTGKGLLVELREYDGRRGSDYVSALVEAVRAGVAGDIGPMTAVCDGVLADHGGRLFEGHRLPGDNPEDC